MSKPFKSYLLSFFHLTDPASQNSKQKEVFNIKIAIRVFSYAFSYPFLIIALYILLFSSNFLSTYNPALGEQLLHILGQNDIAEGLKTAIFWRFAIEVAICLLENAETYVQSLLSLKVERKMQEEFYSSVLDKDVEYHENKKIGDLTSKLNNDLNSVKSLAIFDITGLFGKMFSMVASIIFMINISPILMFTFLLLLAPRVGILWGFKDYFRESNKLLMKLKADATSVVTETFLNIKTVKAFSTEAKEFKKYSKKLDEYGEKKSEITQKEIVYRFGMDTLKSVLFCLIALQGAYFVIDGNLTPFQLSRFISYARQFSMSFMMFEGNIKKIFTSLGNAERIFKDLDTRPKIDSKQGQLVLEKGLNANIIFKNVSFAYPGQKDVKVLKNINVEIKKGEHVAIVGESGGGKTSFVNLIHRQYDPTEGEIQIGNYNIKDFNLKWLHSRMGLISQNPDLFSGTIEENIVYGVDMYSDEDIDKVVSKAYLRKFTEDKISFPNGLQTQVGERGNKLSGGQKQRVAIARALIKNPNILVLDEATSALDAESEHQIMKGLEQLLKNKEQTVIVIAHRLSTIMHCDKIIVFQNGEISEIGNHEQLIAKNNVYKNLVEKQVFTFKESI